MKKIIFYSLLPALILLCGEVFAFTISGPSSGTLGFTGTYTVPSLAGCSTTWTITGGTITSPASCAGSTSCTTTGTTITVKWNCTPGTSHRVDASRPGALCVGTGTLTVTVNSVTMTPGSISGPSPVCPNTDVVYSIAAVANATSYLWSVTGGTIQSGAGTNSITVRWSTASGTKSLVVTPQHNGCNGGTNSSRTITVYTLISTVGNISGPTPVCQSSTGKVYTIPTVTGATTYTWTVPAGATITAGTGTNSITVSFGAAAVSGNVTVTPSNPCGSGATRTFAVTVNNLPPIPGAITGPASACISGGHATYSISPVAGATSYTWTASGGTIMTGAGTSSVTVNWTTSGSRTLSVSAVNACGTGAAASLAVMVYAAPPAHSDLLTLNHSQMAAGTTTALIIDHCSDNHPCAPQTVISSKVYVKFSTGDDHEYGGNVFTASMNVSLKAYNAYTGGTMLTSVLQPLSLNELAPEQWYVWDITSQYGTALRVDVQPQSYSASALVQPKIRMQVYNETQFATAVSGTVSLNAVNTAPSGTNRLNFSWTTTCGSFPNYEIQILRLYNTDVAKAEAGNPLNATVKVDWSEALSLETHSSATSLELALGAGTGYYVWRVRPLGTFYPGGAGNDLNWGQWSNAGSFAQGATVALTGAVSPHSFFYNQHEQNKNWIFSRMYADGDAEHPGVKIKETMSYANGIMQTKQTQMRVSSSDQILVQGNLYDYTGRRSMDVKGVPVDQDHLEYVPQLIQQTPGTLYTAAHFDGPATAREPLPVTAGVISDYYSSANPDVSIPDAQGYPFSRRYFYGDGTERVRAANIPGIRHRFHSSPSGTDMATRIFYAGVADAELLRVFGDEAPDAREVRKLVTLDPNGVASVSYISAGGSTLATCISGGHDTDMLDETGETHSLFTVRDFIDEASVLADGSILTTKPVVFTQPSSLKVYYSITPRSISAACGTFCATCDYKVYFLLHNLTDPEASGFPRKDSLLIPGGSCPASPSGISPFIQYLNLPPGSYMVEKHIYTGNTNPASGRTYADEAAAAYRAQLYAQIQPHLDAVRSFEETGDLDGLNNYLMNTAALPLAPDGRSFILSTSCCEIKIPFEECETPDCGSVNFEQMLLDRWSSDTELALGTNIAAYFPSHWGLVSGNFNTLISNMLADPEYAYMCGDVWDCWKGVVESYKSARLLYADLGYVYDPIDQFLDCAGRNLEGISATRMTASYSSPGYLSHAHRAIQSSAGIPAVCINGVNAASQDFGHNLTYPYPDSAHWHWQQLHDCITAYEPDSVWTVTELETELEGNCYTVCAARYPGFVESLLSSFRADPRYVIAGEGTPGPGQTTITMEMIYCAADEMVQKCNEGCDLSVITSTVPYFHVSAVGTPAELAEMQQSMTWSYFVFPAPPSGVCTAGYQNLGGSGNQGALLADYLNGELESFRDQIGGGTANMNLYALIQNFDASLISSTTCFTPLTSVVVSGTQPSMFYEKTCTLHYVTPTGTDIALCNSVCASTTCPLICFSWEEPTQNGESVDTLFPVSCAQHSATYTLTQFEQEAEACLTAAETTFRQAYSSGCRNPQGLDTYSIEYGLDYYHYTLHYFDRAGNKIRTVAPAGVQLLDVSLPAVQNRQVHPSHTFVTEYEYNSLTQLIRTSSPDKGEMRMYYNRNGQLRFAQTQAEAAAGSYTYFKYDHLGRALETGSSTVSPSSLSAQTDNMAFPSSGTEKVISVFSTASGVNYSASRPQRFLLNQVAHQYSDEDGNAATTTDQIHTYLSYSPEGYNEWAIQELPEIGQQTILYERDPGSGLTTKVLYNEGRRDQFMHRYAYDADNRLLRTETSTDGMIWDRDATHVYFPHGGLARLILGEDKVQGIDYTYTLNGALKAINHPALSSADDPGGDGLSGGAHAAFPKDAFGMLLNYFREDFRHGSSSLNGDASNPWYITGEELFTGQIGGWVSNTQPVSGLLYQQPTALVYKYDVLARLKQAVTHRYASGVYTPLSEFQYSYSYDANSNLTSLQRKGNTAAGLNMDDLTYHYIAGTNRISRVSDAVPATPLYPSDIENQSPGNYAYDLNGRLTGDVQAANTYTWNRNQLVKNVLYNPPGSAYDMNIGFVYDPSGRRAVKTQTLVSGTHVETEFYVSDPSGAEMSVYSKVRTGDTTFYYRTEAPLYASSRIGQYNDGVLVKKVVGSTPVSLPPPAVTGVYTRRAGMRQFELRDHLDNVRATVPDSKEPVNPANLSLGFSASLLSVSNYDPFGAEMPGRVYNANGYRKGFNGMERDDEILGEGNCYDFGARLYDARLGRWLSADPHEAGYPSASPYAFALSNPVSGVDPDGKDVKVSGELQKSQIDNDVIQPFLNSKYGKALVKQLGGEDFTFVFDVMPSDGSKYMWGYKYRGDYTTDNGKHGYRMSFMSRLFLEDKPMGRRTGEMVDASIVVTAMVQEMLVAQMYKQLMVDAGGDFEKFKEVRPDLVKLGEISDMVTFENMIPEFLAQKKTREFVKKAVVAFESEVYGEQFHYDSEIEDMAWNGLFETETFLFKPDIHHQFIKESVEFYWEGGNFRVTNGVKKTISAEDYDILIEQYPRPYSGSMSSSASLFTPNPNTTMKEVVAGKKSTGHLKTISAPDPFLSAMSKSAPPPVKKKKKKK